jgi:hypothetical protein
MCKKFIEITWRRMLNFNLYFLLAVFVINWLVLFAVDVLSNTRSVDLIGEIVAALLLAILLSFEIKK